mmetsp:Transcript_3301/g.10184  ORF Transcript_3301/g.10184 Transcript_3301/m.10184 type:complete len:100 (-) Transcript_3301:105-404(-)
MDFMATQPEALTSRRRALAGRRAAVSRLGGRGAEGAALRGSGGVRSVCVQACATLLLLLCASARRSALRRRRDRCAKTSAPTSLRTYFRARGRVRTNRK